MSLSGCNARRPEAATEVPRGEATPRHRTAARFVDRARAAAVEFVPGNGAEAGLKTILETLGSGAAMLDFDQDGALDLLFVGGGDIGSIQLVGRAAGLFRQSAPWCFTDVTGKAGLAATRFYTHGATVGDYDGDGFCDVLITGYAGLLLYRNQGDGTWADVTQPAGLTGQAWSTGAAWGDVDGDGVLDLYVANYVDWSLKNNPPYLVAWGATSEIVHDTGAPEQFAAVSDWLLMGDGEGSFQESGAARGLVRGGKGLGVVIGDVDVDGDLDIYVANDGTPNFFYRNRGGGNFDEVGIASGTALGDQQRPDGSMGVEMGDADNNGLPDLWVSNYEDQTFALYDNLGDGLFAHASRQRGLAAAGRLSVGFGTCLLDFDSDGDLDLFVANGHIKQIVRRGGFEQLPWLLENLHGRRFVPVGDQAGPYLATPHHGRGAATGDLDGDGDLDLIVSHTNQPVAVLANETPASAHWMAIRLVGFDSQRDAVGARVMLRTATGRQLRLRCGGGSYLSASAAQLHFGLGDCGQVDELEIHWPSGRVQRLHALAADQLLYVHEPRAPR